MVKVYKTDVENPQVAESIIRVLLHEYPAYRVTFDLQDCDRVLRVEGGDFETEHVASLVVKFGSSCVELV